MKIRSVFIVLYALSTGTIPTIEAQCLSFSVTDESSIQDVLSVLKVGSHKFSFDMLNVLNDIGRTDENNPGLFFSPFSIWSSLMLTFLGARGRTEAQLRNVMRIGNWSKDFTWRAFKNIRFLNSIKKNSEEDRGSYLVANRIYFQDGAQVRRCVAEMAESEIAFVDFATDPEGAVRDINDWVSEQTKGGIQRLIPNGGITDIVMVNAVYFHEFWKFRFNASKTKRSRFTLSSGNDVFVDMMKLKGIFQYARSQEHQCAVLELPYRDDSLSMLILLPFNRYNGTSMLANMLTSDKLQDLIYDTHLRKVAVSLPKFSINGSFELSTTLRRLGLLELFDACVSDLSDFVRGSDDLNVGAVHHKSVITVDEEGTIASAASGVISTKYSGPRGEVTFVADHPFLFIIRDRLANLVLFIGKVEVPSNQVAT